MEHNERNNSGGIKAHKAAAEKGMKHRLSKKEYMDRRRIRRIKALAILAALLIIIIVALVAIGKFITGLFNNDEKEEKKDE